MDERLEHIYNRNITHYTFLHKESVEYCMIQSYDLGQKDVIDWLSKMGHLSDNISYIIDEWNNQNDKNG